MVPDNDVCPVNPTKKDFENSLPAAENKDGDVAILYVNVPECTAESKLKLEFVYKDDKGAGVL